MTPFDEFSRLELLFEAAYSDRITASETAELEEILTSDPAARRAYEDFIQMNLRLHFLARADRAFFGEDILERVATESAPDTALPDTALPDTALPDTARDDQPVKQSQPSKPLTNKPLSRQPLTRQPSLANSLLNRASRRPIPPSLAIAMSVIVAVLLWMAGTSVSRWIATSGDNSGDKPVVRENVAQLVFADHAKWVRDRDALDSKSDASESLNIKIGKELYTGQSLFLASGLIEIRYFNGAYVVIEGPAEFELTGKKQGRLDLGKLVVRADREPAKGFIVETPWAKIEDLGTEFGVDVAGNGLTDLHVVEGKVSLVSRPTPESGVSPVEEIFVAGGAARVEPGAKLIVLANGSNKNRFARLRKLVHDDDPPSAPVTEGLSLWLAADKGVEADASGHVSVWRDARGWADDHPAVGRSPSEEHHPQWVADAIAGEPAIRFDGQHRLDLPTAAELGLANSGYEIFIVAQSRSPKCQFLLAGGQHEKFEMHLNYLDNRVGFGFIPNRREYRDFTQDGELTDGRPHIFSARVEQDRGYRGVVRVDGVDRRGVPAVDVRSNAAGALRLGMRFNDTLPFHGDIAEVLIYSRALSRTERQHVEAYLASRYGITKRRRDSR